MASKTIPPSPPNPHIAAMAVPVDTTLQPQYVTSPEDEIKSVNYPYNLVNEFTVTCYSKTRVKESDKADLYDSEGKLLSSTPLIAGGTFEFGGAAFYSLYVKFTLDRPLPSPQVTVILSVELFGPTGGNTLRFRFSDFVEPDREYAV
jgi:hypothetical protein